MVVTATSANGSDASVAGLSIGRSLILAVTGRSARDAFQVHVHCGAARTVTYAHNALICWAGSAVGMAPSDTFSDPASSSLSREPANWPGCPSFSNGLPSRVADEGERSAVSPMVSLPGGIEGRIHALKRNRGLKRSRYHGESGFGRWLGWRIVAYNLSKIAENGASKR